MKTRNSANQSRAWMLPFALLTTASFADGQAAESSGVLARFEKYRGPATVQVESPERHKALIEVVRNGETDPLTLAVELPATGPGVWPLADVEVLDSNNQPVAVRRGGIEWHKIRIQVHAGQRKFTIHAVKPKGGRTQNFPEKARRANGPVSGLSATIGKWPEGRRAALSLRFDDSHPTHLSKAIPILREYGFKGTFMINPGRRDGRASNSRWRSAFQEHLAEWEAVARRGDQEFANHSARHRGAINDADMDHEIGDAANVIWELFPNKSKLTALNLGGGTQWETTRTLRHYLDKYHQFETGGSLGMDDVYGGRVEAFRQHLLRHLERGIWCRIHFHYIGEKLSSSEENFRATLNIAKENESELWIAGMADIFKYQTERAAATLTMESAGPNTASLRLSCSTDPALFDHLLTLQVTLPRSWPHDSVMITGPDGERTRVKQRSQDGKDLLYFEVEPVNSIYRVEKLE